MKIQHSTKSLNIGICLLLRIRADFHGNFSEHILFTKL